ncbi:hypothetical protein FA95DRAFT_1557197 [Auriscalpium vulgare]|uniref:Uncharacterized protein n=1 Tax=Auriscalpium vulgare TaxID=40419 RepID=A0ACB8RXT5_9AGAM|nr:hypothetical protein FA95DRAFT_1557197 [Auriscalpium vulgare]
MKGRTKYYGFAIDEVELYKASVASGEVKPLPDAARCQTEAERATYVGSVMLRLTSVLLGKHLPKSNIKNLKCKCVEIGVEHMYIHIWVLPEEYWPKADGTQKTEGLQAFKQAMGITEDPTWIVQNQCLHLRPMTVDAYLDTVMKAFY